ncbi:clathrin interactor EPSIN 1-like [Vicia villosa]|uniref:clathrin interactor EPSIN 1-like n=1 Tax=Vicia villosa TaxID=3911 RepID=UPI00273AA2E6|nr:clathrin interactor EPSIN 1-like [Vicia villosa]
MDFMKVFDQTVREIKREVNLKVLKVPEIEQKVLDATDDEPWGPHGTALAEIATATKKFTECQLVMNVLWTRLSETGKDWRYVYKALAVIEYLVSHGSERAVDDIIEHTFQISALSSFEYVEPSGKDVGLNVRKKSENIVSLLNDREKISQIRNKAAANRDKYVGVSSSGITYKSGTTSFSSGSSQSSSKYGGFGSRDNDRYSDSYGDKGRYDEDKVDNDYSGKSRHGVSSNDQENSFKKGSARSVSKSKEKISSRASKSSANASSVPSQSTSVTANDTEDDFDDFDPRGTSTKTTAGSSNQVDLFGQDLIGDLMDAPTSVSVEKPATNDVSEVDLFADAAFVSAPPQMDRGASSQPQEEVDLFSSQPAISSATPTVDLFSIPAPAVQPDSKSENSVPVNNSTFDPFASVPLNNFDGSDLFGDFTSQSDTVSSQPSPNAITDGSTSAKSLAVVSPKKDAFQVKSGIWADSLSRGLIDLNISAPKKVSLVDVGIVGGLNDGADEREKGPPAAFYMGRAMGSGSGLGMYGGTPSQPTTGDDMFSNFGSQNYQFGGFQK